MPAGAHLRDGRRPGVLERQVEREGAALAGRAAQLDLAAEQVGELAADGEAQAGAAVLAAGAGVRLLERLEDDLLLLGRDADAGVGDLEGDDRAAPWPGIGWSALQPPARRRHARRTPPCSVNLKALDSRFFSTCCRRLESVTMLRVEMADRARRRRTAAAARPRAGTAARPSRAGW